jgi:nuclear pore complex protein Nup205
MTENPNIDAVGCIEAAIVEHHRRRRDLVDCLRCLLTAAAQAGTPHSARIHARIDEFVKRDLLPGYETPGGRVYLAQELFTKIEATGTVISKVHADRQSAGSNTTVPTAQGE